jgi:N-acetylglutamate synthase-like GNAT family acetyltransferase
MFEDAQIAAERNDEQQVTLDLRDVSLRAAHARDLPAVAALVSAAVAAGQILPMTEAGLAARLRDLTVAELGGSIVGLVSAHLVSASRGELGLLLSADSGLRALLIEAAVDQLAGLGAAEVFCFTHQAAPLLDAGFQAVARAEVPQKALGACLRCSAAPRCRKVALLRAISA